MFINETGEDPTNPKKTKKKPSKFNKKAFKHAISMVESSGGKFMWNKTSSATGKYQFLYNLIKTDPSMKGVSRREFLNRDDLQELVMDRALDGKLRGFTYGEGYANKLKKEFNSDYDVNSLTAMVHFLGPGNARKFLKDPVSFRVPGKVNLTGDEYISKFSKYFDKYNLDNPATPDNPPESFPATSPKIRESKYLEQPKDNIPQQNSFNMQDLLSKLPKDIDNYESRQSELNSFRNGGEVEGASGADELVTLFEGGGTHEENPLGGIPQGMGANGKPNLVEEGETKWNDYIFSNAFDMEGNFTGEDGNKSNVFEKGGKLDPPTGKVNAVSKEEEKSVFDYITNLHSTEKMTEGKTANTVGNLYGNLSQYFTGKKDHDLKDSPYRPTVKGSDDKKYYTRPGMREDVYVDLTSERVKKDYNHSGDFNDIHKGLLSKGKDRVHNADNAFPKNQAGYRGQVNKGHGNIIGQFNLGRYITDAGEDENGKYISFSDTYDWNGSSFKNKEGIEFYDRIYENQWDSFKNSKNKNSNSFKKGGKLDPTDPPGPKEEEKPFSVTKQNHLSSPTVKEEMIIPDVRDQYRTQAEFPDFKQGEDVNFSKAVKGSGAQAFLNRYNHAITRKRMMEQSGVSNENIDNMILKGLSAKKHIGGNTKGSKASYSNDTVHMGEDYKDNHNVETHERVHASGIDGAMGIALTDVLGNAFHQEGKEWLKKTSPSTLDYLNQPHEAYGNFSEFRSALGMKPGDKIDKKKLERLVKEKGLGMENFYRAYNTDKIVKALNTIAYQESNNNEYKLS